MGSRAVSAGCLPYLYAKHRYCAVPGFSFRSVVRFCKAFLSWLLYPSFSSHPWVSHCLIPSVMTDSAGLLQAGQRHGADKLKALLPIPKRFSLQAKQKSSGSVQLRSVPTCCPCPPNHFCQCHAPSAGKCFHTSSCPIQQQPDNLPAFSSSFLWLLPCSQPPFLDPWAHQAKGMSCSDFQNVMYVCRATEMICCWYNK